MVRSNRFLSCDRCGKREQDPNPSGPLTDGWITAIEHCDDLWCSGHLTLYCSLHCKEGQQTPLGAAQQTAKAAVLAAASAYGQAVYDYCEGLGDDAAIPTAWDALTKLIEEL